MTGKREKLIGRTFIIILGFVPFIGKGQLIVKADTVIGYAWQKVSVPVRIKYKGLVTAQGTIDYNDSLLQIQGVSGFNSKTQLDASNFNLKRKGKISFSWDDVSLNGIDFGLNEPLFNLDFYVIGKVGRKAELIFSESPVIQEYTNVNQSKLNPELGNGLVVIREFRFDTAHASIRTGFSPNGDGINDKWEVLEGYPYLDDMIIQVYNTNGDKLFYSEGNYSPWDGYTNGLLVPAGTYYFTIDLNNGRNKFYKGFLVISH